MISKYNLKIEENLFNFVNSEVIPGTNINTDIFWKNFSELVDDLMPINIDLLHKRKKIQNDLDSWHKKNIGLDLSPKDYKKFLLEIDYLVEEGEDFLIDTKNVDPEIANISGPQLVVPITNSRYAINAVNARWGSFYDALYGTDALGDMPKGNSYDSERGKRVVAFAKSHLDKFAPLLNTSWKEINKIQLIDNKIILRSPNNSNINLKDNDQIMDGDLIKNQFFQN